MSGNPAIAAWERSAAKTSPLDALAAAREALAPLRDLHKPSFDGDEPYCATCCHTILDDYELSYQTWPCDTARLLYSSSELEGDSDA